VNPNSNRGHSQKLLTPNRLLWPPQPLSLFDSGHLVFIVSHLFRSPMSNRYPSLEPDAQIFSEDSSIFQSDQRDDDYNPLVEHRQSTAQTGMSVLFTSQIRRTVLSTAASQKLRARNSDPKEGRCILSNEGDPSCSIEVAHILPKATGFQTVNLS
jgi:hypothetical protein